MKIEIASSPISPESDNDRHLQFCSCLLKQIPEQILEVNYNFPHVHNFTPYFKVSFTSNKSK